MAEEILRPRALVIPSITTAVRDVMAAEAGTLIYDVTQSKLCFCKSGGVVGTSSWELISSVEES